MLTRTRSISGPRAPTPPADVERLRDTRLQTFTEDNDNDLVQRLWDGSNDQDNLASTERRARLEQALASLDRQLEAQ